MERKGIRFEAFREANFSSAALETIKQWELSAFITGLIIVILNSCLVTMILYSTFKNRKKSVSKLLTLSLGCSDLLTGLCIVLYYILESYLYSSTVLLALSLIISFTICVSLLHAFALTADRLMAISFPFRYRDRSFRLPGVKVIIAIWLLSVSITALSLVKVYYFGLVLSFIIILTGLFMPVAYCIIFFKLRNLSKRQQQRNSQSQRHSIQKERKRAVYCVLIVAGFIICSFPLAIVTCFDIGTGDPHIASFPVFLIMMNAVWNPILFLLKKLATHYYMKLENDLPIMNNALNA